MGWIHIDAEHGMTIARVMVDSGTRSGTLIQHLRSLGDVPGLGWAQSEVGATVQSSAAAIERATTSYLQEGVDMMTRLRALLNEQAAGSVVGQVLSPAAVIGGSTMGVAVIGGGYINPTASGTSQTIGGGYSFTPLPSATQRISMPAPRLTVPTRGSVSGQRVSAADAAADIVLSGMNTRGLADVEVRIASIREVDGGTDLDADGYIGSY